MHLGADRASCDWMHWVPSTIHHEFAPCYSFLCVLVQSIRHSPCVLIILFLCVGCLQIRLMQFLLEAIRRNATKIGLTMLLCLVVLYVFSTVTYMFFRDMYGFGVSPGITELYA